MSVMGFSGIRRIVIGRQKLCKTVQFSIEGFVSNRCIQLLILLFKLIQRAPTNLSMYQRKRKICIYILHVVTQIPWTNNSQFCELQGSIDYKDNGLIICLVEVCCCS